MAQIHRRRMQNCASIGAGAQIPGTQFQKEVETTSSVEEHGNPWVASANQTVSLRKSICGAFPHKPPREEINE